MVFKLMSMDGIFRPTQMLGYTDVLNTRDGADRAREDAQNIPQVSKDSNVDNIDKDPHEKKNPDRDLHQQDEDTTLEDDLQALLINQFNITFQPGVVYRFLYNEITDRIELLDTSNQQVLLQFTPAEFIYITESLKNQAGMITDRTA